jgi:tetratricopeptide (TPR) repeat protein
MALISEGAFEAMRGRFDEARQHAAAGRSQYKELGFALDWAGSSMLAGRIELIAGDPVGAERKLREGYEELERIGETGYLSTVAGLLAEAVSERAAVRDDFDSQGAWRSARAEALAEQGHIAEAERLAREAIDLLDPTDLLMNRADAHTALAAVLRLAGRPDEAVAELQAAVELHERKGDVVSAGRARVLIDELAPAGLPAAEGT